MTADLTSDALRLAAILDKTKPLPAPSEVYRPETGADWAFQVTTLDAMARMVGPLARELHAWQQMATCEEHGRPIYYEGDECPACRERDLLARLEDLTYQAGPASLPAPPVPQRHQWQPAAGSLAGSTCLHCGVWQTGAEPELCALRGAGR